jgi:hypothetical protein
VAIARAREETIGGGVVAPEDVIVLKLIAGRAQDIADIEAILAGKPSLIERGEAAAREVSRLATRLERARRVAPELAARIALGVR